MAVVDGSIISTIIFTIMSQIRDVKNITGTTCMTVT